MERPFQPSADAAAGRVESGEASGRDREIDRQLAVEMFRRLRWGGAVPLVYIPTLVLGSGYVAMAPAYAWTLLLLNQFNVLVRSWMANKAYLEREHPDPRRVGWWQARLRVVSVWQALTWSVLNTSMLLDFGHTDPGYLVMACIVGWTAVSPAFVGTDVRLSRMLCLVNPAPLLIWLLSGTWDQSWFILALTIGLMGIALLFTGLQYGYVRGMFAAQIDLEAAHRQLRAATTAAESAAAAKGQFLANMSHEIRTPLNGIIGLSEMLHQSGLDPRAAEITADLRRSGQQLLAIVNDVLDLSKIGASKMTVESVPLDARGILRECAADFERAALSKGLWFACEVAPDFPPSILGDAVRIRQVLSNLIANAIKFTASGGVRVTLEECEAGGLRFTVADTGIGIPADRVQEVFEEFSQAEASTTRRFGGTGLGLAISRKLALLMGGSLRVESDPGRGSRFEFRLPLAAAPEAGPPAPAKPALEALALPPGFRVLIVDDTPVNLRICVHFVKRAGAEVESAANGAAAIAMHEAQPFDLILMDCHMPELDGWQATERIRALRGPASRTPILALTADVFPEVRERCAASGMNGYLSKPIQIEELHSALKAYADLAYAPGIR